MTYSPGQLEVIYPYLKGLPEPQWLILGGPADANEAQTAIVKWPGIKVVGVEPNPEAYNWQLANDWPEGCPLLPYALSSTCSTGEMVYRPGALRNASLDSEAVRCNHESPNSLDVTFLIVKTITLDYLDERYGPFEDAVVWMDIEGSEYLALMGAERLIASRRVLLWNIEMLSRVPNMMEGVPRLLEARGYRAVREWNDSDTCRDRIYVRRG